MKVEIVSCSDANFWYSDNIGTIYDVEQHPHYNDFYRLIDLHCVIKKEDCGEVFEVMHHYLGAIEVLDIGKNHAYKIAGKDQLVFKDLCEVVKNKQEKEMKQEFTKSDLKNFMRVKYRDGQMRIFIDGRFYGNGYMSNRTDFYNSKLQYENDLEIDIVAVYQEPLTQVFNECIFGELIWERKEKSEQEIELEKLQEQIKALEKQAQKLKETMQK